MDCLTIYMIKRLENIKDLAFKIYIFHNINEYIMCIFKLASIIKAWKLCFEFIDTESLLKVVNKMLSKLHLSCN